jgi:hypothetical protein
MASLQPREEIEGSRSTLAKMVHHDITTTAKFTWEVKKKRKAALLVLYLHTTVGFLRFLWECGPGMLCIRA